MLVLKRFVDSRRYIQQFVEMETISWYLTPIWVRSVICVKVHKATEFFNIFFESFFVLLCKTTLILSESHFWHKEWLLGLHTNQTFDQSDGLFVVKFMCWTEWNCYIKSYWWSWPFPFPQCNPYSLRLTIIKGGGDFALFEPGFSWGWLATQMMGGDARGRGQVSPDQSPGLHTQMARTASLMWKVQIHRCVGLGKVNSRDQILGGTIKMDKLWWIL